MKSYYLQGSGSQGHKEELKVQSKSPVQVRKKKLEVLNDGL
jgi:hypothetical protein